MKRSRKNSARRSRWSRVKRRVRAAGQSLQAVVAPQRIDQPVLEDNPVLEGIRRAWRSPAQRFLFEQQLHSQ